METPIANGSESQPKESSDDATSMGPGEFQDHIKKIDAALDIVKGCLRTGMVFSPPPYNVTFGMLAEVSSLIQYVLVFTPEKPNETHKKMNELIATFEELNKKTKGHFDNLKSFITEHHFKVEVITQIATLKELMHDCMQDWDKDAIKNFLNVYQQNTPLYMTYTLANLLDLKFTNPVLMTLDVKEGQTSANFKKWKDIISAVLSDYFMIEDFASGLIANKSIYNCNLILQEAKLIFKELDNMEVAYTKSQNYWTEMKDFVEKQGKRTDVNNMQKAEIIRNQLETYLTNDSFYIFVFNEATRDSEYTYFCPKSSSNIIGSWNQGGCNVLVYRSQTAYTKEPHDKELMYEHLRSCETGVLTYKATLRNMIEEQLLAKQQLDPYGFIGLIYTSKVVYIESIKTREPGRYTTITMKDSSSDKNYKYFLIAAYE